MGRLRVDTLFGRLLIEYTGKGINALYLPGDNFADGLTDETGEGSEKAEKAANLLRRYFSGKKIDFKALPVDLTGRSPFFHTVANRVRTIPYGAIFSYKEVAQGVARPGAARAVGRVMASNPIPIIIPCHRVLASNGDLTGYSAEGGLGLKARLLQMEGVEFKAKGTVLL